MDKRLKIAGLFVLFALPAQLFAVDENRLGCGFEGGSVWESQAAVVDRSAVDIA